MGGVAVHLEFGFCMNPFRHGLRLSQGDQAVDVGQLALVGVPVHYVVNLLNICLFLYHSLLPQHRISLLLAH